MSYRKLCAIFLFIVLSCSDDESTSNTGNNSIEIPSSIYERIYGVTSPIDFDDEWVYINVNSLPDHESPYL